MYVFNSCKYDEYEISMYGRRHIGCVHPMRKSLDGFFDKILGIFTKRRPCAAVLGHERHCPYYKCRYPRPSMPPSRPSMSPFSNKTTPIGKEKEQAVKSWNEEKSKKMKIRVSHISKSLNLTAVTFCPETKSFYRGETAADIAIPVDQAYEIERVISALEQKGFVGLDEKAFNERAA